MGGRRTQRALTLLVATLTLAGCSSSTGSYYSTDVDLARARAVWQDPWAAPDEPSVPGVAYGSNGQVLRGAGTRTRTYDGPPAPAVADEVRVALDQGWRLAGATCTADRVYAVLARGDGVDDSALASVQAESSSMTVDVVVPHHLDGSWPTTSEVDPAQTCLTTGVPSGSSPEVPEGAPLSGSARIGSIEDDPDHEWQQDDPTDEESALVEEVEANPWLAGSTGLVADSLEARDERRLAPYLEDQVPDLARAVEEAGAAGWVPTWATCDSAGLETVTLRLVTDAGVAVARVGRGRNTSGQDAVLRVVRLPVQGGPDQSWVAEVPELSESVCLRPDAPSVRTVEGTPVALPGRLTPFAR